MRSNIPSKFQTKKKLREKNNTSKNYSNRKKEKKVNTN
jgi:hypothetical protein